MALVLLSKQKYYTEYRVKYSGGGIFMGRKRMSDEFQVVTCFPRPFAMATLPRKPAPRPAKPAHRHFARKAPKDARDLDESSEEEQEQAVVEEQSDVEIGTFTNELDSQTFAGAGKTQEKGAKALKVALGNVQVQDGKVIIDGKAESGKTLVEQRAFLCSSELAF